MGINQHNWGYEQQPYNNPNMMGNRTQISSYGRNSYNQGNSSYNQGNETRNMYQQTYQNQQQQYTPWPNQEVQLYNTYQQGNESDLNAVNFKTFCYNLLSSFVTSLG